jgi:hypothetical protein
MMFRPGRTWEGRRPLEDSTLPAQAPRARTVVPAAAPLLRRMIWPAPSQAAEAVPAPVRKTKAIIPNGGVVPLEALPMTRPSVRVRRSLPVVLSYLLFVNPASTGSVTPVT